MVTAADGFGITFGLHRLPGVWAEHVTSSVYLSLPGSESRYTGWRVRQGPQWAHFDLHLISGDPGPYPDWLTVRASVMIEGYRLGGNGLPLSFYVGEPTDMPTGVLRFPDPELPGELWMLTARRSA